MYSFAERTKTCALSGTSFFASSRELRHLSKSPALYWSFARDSRTAARALFHCLVTTSLCVGSLWLHPPPASTIREAAAAAAAGTANRLRRFIWGRFMNCTFPRNLETWLHPHGSAASYRCPADGRATDPARAS